MEYTVYTDGSCQSSYSRAASSYIIRTDNKFVHTDVKAFATVYILEAELYAIIAALNHLLHDTKIKKGDTVVVCVDSMEAVKQCRAILNREWTKNTSVTGELVSIIRQVQSVGVTLRFKKVHAHKDTMNSNKFVDRLAKCGLKHSDICMR